MMSDIISAAVVGGNMFFGAAYYPEHWDASLWERDARLMREAGFNLVRVGEFAWHEFEPEENRFEFQWLDDALDVLDRQGIRAIVGTPTGTVPAWVAARYPTVMALQHNGERLHFGGRKNYCFRDPDFLRLSLRVTERIARRYADDRRVVGFQTDNEFDAPLNTACRCDRCLHAFRDFLRDRYKSIDALNKEWGTRFWGASYNSFDEIGWPPVHMMANPSFQLDLKRFQSNESIVYQQRQIDVLRKFAPNKFITHNMMGLYPDLNFYELGKPLDFASWDNYPLFLDGYARISDTAFAHLVMRSVKEDAFLVMEEQSGPGGWETYPRQARPGEMELWALQAVARGANGIMMFRWRTSVSGQEEYWHGILGHDNVPRRRYRETARLGAALKAISPKVLNTTPVADVGILYDYDQIWATSYQPQNGSDPLLFRMIACEMARALVMSGANFGAAGSHSKNFDRFRLIACPPLYLTDPDLVGRLEDYVRNGGNLLLTAGTGVKTLNNVCRMEPLPGMFRNLSGLKEIDEYDIVPRGKETDVLSDFGAMKATRIREALVPNDGTEVLARHAGGVFDGTPALVRSKFGKGSVWHLGTQFRPDDWKKLFERIMTELEIPFFPDLPNGIEVCRRADGTGRVLTFVLNHNDAETAVSGLPSGTDILSGKDVSGELALAPFAVAIIEETPQTPGNAVARAQAVLRN